jgi:hypothetical protein
VSEAVTAADGPLERVAAALRSHHIEAIVVDTGSEAREAVLRLIPEGSEVHSGKSKTLADIGLYSELIESGRYDALRTRLANMDRATHGVEMRKMTATPDFMLGSVAAITEDGALVAASATGSQLAGYLYGAGLSTAALSSPHSEVVQSACLPVMAPACMPQAPVRFPLKGTQ